MLYECSCGYQSSTATSFYRHLAQFKDAYGQHHLVNAKLQDSPPAPKPRPSASAPAPAPSAPPLPTSTVAQDPATSTFRSPFPAGVQPLARPPTSTSRPTSAPIYPPIPASGAEGSTQRDASSSQPPMQGSHACSGAGITATSTTTTLTGPQTQTDAQQQAARLRATSETTAQQQLRYRGGRGPSGSGMGGDTLEIDCAQKQQRQPGATAAAATPSAMPDLFMQASSAMGSLLMYGLNPLRLFGLSETAGAGAGAAAASGQAGPSTVGVDAHALAARSTGGGALAPAVGSSAQALALASQSIASCDAVLLWRDPWRSFRVFALGLYLCICAQSLASGALPVLPSTALLAAALLYLTQNALRTALRPDPAAASPRASAGGTDPTALMQSPLKRASSAPDPAAVAAAAAAEGAEEQRLFVAVQGFLTATCSLLIPAIAAAVVMVYRALSGRRLVTTAITWACLWVAMLVGELRIMGQLPFAVLGYVAIFAVPALYVRSREGLDILVEDLVRLLLRLVLGSSRVALAGAGVSALVVYACMAGSSPVLKASAAGAAALAVLLWQARPAQQAQQQQQQQQLQPGDLKTD